MPATIPAKLQKISDEIAKRGNVPLTRLTVLKKWFEPQERLTAFGVWRAAHASQNKNSGAAAELFQSAQSLLAGADEFHPHLNQAAAESLHDRLRAFQNVHQNQQWTSVRIVTDWNLMLVEKGLEIYLWRSDSPTHGYKLAADYCQHYDPRYGNGLNGPSAVKIGEIMRFVATREKWENARASTGSQTNAGALGGENKFERAKKRR